MHHTCDPALTSFVSVAKDSHFPIQNIPFGVFSPRTGGDARVATAIGDFVLDLGALEAEGMFNGPELKGKKVFQQDSLNAFMALGRPAWVEARSRISELLCTNVAELRDNSTLRERCLVRAADAVMHLPAKIGDYTDFYSSREHATNVGIMFRGKDNALMPNWLHLPVAYHGRASSIVVSGTSLHRPCGQTLLADSETPVYGPSRLVDIELEMGFLVGPGTQLGDRVSVDDAADHIFGLVLVNDWSARDIQKWEYQPLGPFLAKNFGTSIAPWVVTLEALEPFRCEGPKQQDPEPLPYLKSSGARTWDIELNVGMKGAEMPEYHNICTSNFKYLYWNVCQQLAHHSVTGCNMNPGDMLASGTISGPDKTSFGSLLEITWRGTEAITFPSGEQRRFMQDGDSILITGSCSNGEHHIGFGEVEGTILPVKE